MPKFSSLKQWGESLPKWDKKDWIKKLVEHIPAVDKVQAELYLKGWLIRVYIQACNPKDQDDNSIVNRWFLIFHQQKQESGKSAFFRWLAPNPKWVKGNGLEDNKDGYIALCRYMLVLDDELGGLSRLQQQERIKSMVSSSKIDVRPPYGKVDLSVSRTASFCGSTNHDDIFPPSEGTTRFLMLPLKDQDFGWEKYITDIDKVKLWSQVKHLASTSWLKVNTPALVKYREETNKNYVREDLESFVVTRFLQLDNDSPVVLSTGDIMRVLCDQDYGYNNLNINRLGQALKKVFGDRVNGFSKGNKRTKGYKVKILPAFETPRDTAETPKKVKAKTKKLFQR
jgi:predicted P-loop ATPase